MYNYIISSVLIHYPLFLYFSLIFKLHITVCIYLFSLYVCILYYVYLML